MVYAGSFAVLPKPHEAECLMHALHLSLSRHTDLASFNLDREFSAPGGQAANPLPAVGQLGPEGATTAIHAKAG